MRKTRSLSEMDRHPLISAHTLGLSLSTRNPVRKASREHETSRQRNFILRPTTAKGPLTKFRHSRRLRIQRRLMQVKPPAVFMTPLSQEKRSAHMRMEVTGRFSARAQIRSHSTKRTRSEEHTSE